MTPFPVLRMLIVASSSLFPGLAFAFDLSIEAPTDPGIVKDIGSASLLKEINEDDTTNPQDIIAAARADYERIVGVLYGKGYFGPVVNITIDGREASSVSTISPPASVRSVNILVVPGEKFQFGTATVGPLANGTEIPPAFASGQRAQIPAIRDAADAAVEGWRNEGHAKAKLANQNIVARHRESQIDVDLEIDEGPKLTFGDVIVTGNSAVRTQRIVEIAGVPKGEVFSPDELRRAATRLRRTGTFRVAALTEEDDYNPDLSLDIDAQITENLPRAFGFGAELSSLEGLGLSGYWLHRNLFGGAERIRFDGEISGIAGDTGGIDYSLGVRFDRPATFNEDTDFYALGEIERLDQVGFESNQITLETGIVWRPTDQLEYSLGLGLLTADVTDAFGDRTYTLLTFPASATLDYRDDKLNAKDGYYLNASLTPFVALKGSETGARAYADARAYKSFGLDDRVTFALRGQLGALAGASLENAPADFLFYSGGSGTVRGQNFQSLGVELANGREVGGRSFIGLSGEVRVATGKNLSLVGFYDAGFISSDQFPTGDNGEWHSGAGLGVRYNTGIGPIRLDIGVPTSGPDDQSGFEVYIGIGQAF